MLFFEARDPELGGADFDEAPPKEGIVFLFVSEMQVQSLAVKTAAFNVFAIFNLFDLNG